MAPIHKTLDATCCWSWLLDYGLKDCAKLSSRGLDLVVYTSLFVLWCVALCYAVAELALCKVEMLFDDYCCLSSIVTIHSMQHVEVYK